MNYIGRDEFTIEISTTARPEDIDQFLQWVDDPRSIVYLVCAGEFAHLEIDAARVVDPEPIGGR